MLLRTSARVQPTPLIFIFVTVWQVIAAVHNNAPVDTKPWPE